MQENAEEVTNGIDDDGYPWPSLLLLGLTKLNLSQQEFWDMSPRTYLSLVDAYNKLEHPQEEQETAQQKQPVVETTTIDEAPSWW